MRVNHEPGFVLHTRPYSETSLLVDLFCRHHGRFMALAKGARRQKSGMRGVLMPFTPLLVSWAGKGQLPILTNAESPGFVPPLNNAARHSAYYMNELLLKLLHRFDDHPELYDHYHNGVHQLTRGDDPSVVLRMFEKQLLRETGFGLILDHDVETGEPVTEDQEYRYIPDRGPVAFVKNNSSSIASEYNTVSDQEVRSAAAGIGHKISGKTLSAMQTGNFDPLTVRQARALNRSLIQQQLGNKTIRSRRVMLQVLNYQNRQKS